MNKKGMLVFSTLLVLSTFTGCGTAKMQEISLPKSEYTNPIVQRDKAGDFLYGGDPSILVSGDVVYLYTGHDASTKEEVKKKIYNIPEYDCYSSTDMVHWKNEGVVMNMDTVEWAGDDKSAWASQVMEHKDPETGENRYYLYYCSWDKTGKQCIGVAISDSPTGQFVDIGTPLVRSTQTKPSTTSYNDIDPTAWIETDENGEEHRYLAWGNGIFYVCELNEDMISIVDVNGDGKIVSSKNDSEADILTKTAGLDNYTEAPWIYRRKDESGNYYGDYYLFFAQQWRECMAYARTDDLLQGQWSKPKMIMAPTTTSNTNHMAVFDFKGKTYFVYHNGSLPGGNGYKRSACIRELSFDDNGDVTFMEETAAGLSGTSVMLTLTSGEIISHEGFINDTSDTSYPYKNVAVGINLGNSENDGKWVLCEGKADTSDTTLVSIQSENKPGLYFTATSDGDIVLAQDTDASEKTALKQTFRSKSASSDSGEFILESMSQTGKYIVLLDGKLKLVENIKDATVFIYK